MSSKFMDLSDKLQVDGPKNALLEFMDLNDKPLQVGGPLVHFTLKIFLCDRWSNNIWEQNN
jgi:hypothetical protein